MLEILIMDQNFESIQIIDSFESFIWSDRYNTFGDFELYQTMDRNMFSLLRPGYYVWIRESNHVMLIEENKINTSTEDGAHLVTTGRSLESILDRRIVWDQTLLQGNLQNGLKNLITKSITNPSIADRKISNFIFEESADPRITSLTVDAQLYGDNLYDVIVEQCELNDLGFHIILSENNQFVFKLYYGEDRSYEQEDNPYVVFSPSFDNLISSNYLESAKTLKTVALVAGENDGEGENPPKKTVVVNLSPDDKGLYRREMFSNSSLSSEVDGVKMTAAEYNSQLEQYGKTDLMNNIFVTSFEGELESTQMYKYMEDFFIGDILQLANEYGIESRVRLVEIVRSYNTSGNDVVPTFSPVY